MCQSIFFYLRAYTHTLTHTHTHTRIHTHAHLHLHAYTHTLFVFNAPFEIFFSRNIFCQTAFFPSWIFLSNIVVVCLRSVRSRNVVLRHLTESDKLLPNALWRSTQFKRSFLWAHSPQSEREPYQCLLKRWLHCSHSLHQQLLQLDQ